jgi:hypothetical protein
MSDAPPTAFDAIAARAGHGALSLDEARALWRSTDLVAIGILAEEARRRRHGDRATFVRVAEVPLDGIEAAVPPAAAGEIRLTGVPSSAEAALDAARRLVSKSGKVPVSAYVLGDLAGLAGTGAGLRSLLEHLHEAGVSAVAEAQVDALVEDHAVVDALRAAGLPVARWTVGAIPEGDAPALLLAVRALQRRAGLLRSVAPLPRLRVDGVPTTGYHDAKLVALARLVLDNVASIQVDWSRSSAKPGQLALLFGADDVDGVSAVEDTGDGKRRSPLAEIRRNIEAASLAPVERDGRFAVRE